jgi:hypothetical protein
MGEEWDAGRSVNEADRMLLAERQLAGLIATGLIRLLPVSVAVLVRLSSLVSQASHSHSPCASFAEVCLQFSKRNSAYKPSSRLLRLLLITFTMLLFLCLSIFVSTTNSWSICLGLRDCSQHPLPNGLPDLQLHR